MSVGYVPVEIPYRPYGICPPTNLMNPDGFFIVNMGNQIIETFVTNQSGQKLHNVSVYIEGISDSGIVLSPSIKYVGDVLPDASIPVRFQASFLNATPGTSYVSFIIESNGFDFKRIIKKIFITRIDYHKPTKTYRVVTPQGTVKINIHKAIMNSSKCDCGERDSAVIALPTDVTYSLEPNPSYEGIRGPLPYEDPWWKIVLAILAALFAGGALLYDYFSDGDLDGGTISVGGTFDEVDGSISCCDSVTTAVNPNEEGDWLLRGLYAAAGGAASAAIASDDPDLHYRGQEKTPPKKGEITKKESVRLVIKYPIAPSPGVNYPIEGKWKYIRTTDQNQYSYDTYDQRKNPHFLNSYTVEAPEKHDRRNDPLKIKAVFKKPDNSLYRGNELYVSGVLVSEFGHVRRFELNDSGIELDQKPNDGVYCGGYKFVRKSHQDESENQDNDPRGDWYLFIFAQNVNTVKEGTEPFIAAHTIGSFVLTSQLKLDFNNPCNLDHDAVIHVV